ncbi:maleylpyruvate isomerase N-terminal domain-containing protein [Glycomyces sp. A-F 0318]|uniref:maleylpyruvate isomerase N-terminal domain-containing protein n=1 Tax=Glycomyces amatae TaxID=2881355 RepID=UPI001E5187B5|nr:maleylpyruvate isomerase N-terminal domain-containing protein [Glycomyces amatae]MCD0445139.1 maleylpyruvate isomerase N-terminal domain-containing protein [Glycomyces amatae]
MTDTPSQYLAAARTALGLLEDPAVAGAWDGPSALEGFTVGGLAAHLAQQVTSVTGALAADYAGKPLIGLFEHYDRAAWVGTGTEGDANAAIRAGGEEAAQRGPDAVLDQAREALAELEAALPGLDGSRISGNTRWPYATTLHDFLHTRILELVVHTDDLAHSVGVDTPVFDQDAFDTAAHMLTRLSAKRHGQAALVRALARSERAPETVSGL